MSDATGTTPAEWYVATVDLLRRVRDRWIFVAVLSFGGAAVTTGVVLVLPSYYTASGAFQAESTVPSQLLTSSLGGLASQLGNLGLSGTNNAQLFGDLLTSEAVMRRVAGSTFPWRDGSSALPKIYGYDRQDAGLSQYNTVKKLRRSVSVDVNLRTGEVKFSIEARSPALALALADTTLAALNDASVALRQQRASAERTFSGARAEQARSELDSSEFQLTAFYERNRVISNSPALQMEEARLKRNVDMSQQVYVQLRLQAEQAAIQEVRNTPAITVVDPPVLPIKRSWPHRTVGVIFGFLIGMIVALLRLFLPTIATSPTRTR